MIYNKEELALLNYKELRKLCKQTGVKANKKHVELVNDLVEYFKKEENELQELEKEMEVYQECDLNLTFSCEEDNDEQTDTNRTYDKEEHFDENSDNNGTYNKEKIDSSSDNNGTFETKESQELSDKNVLPAKSIREREENIGEEEDKENKLLKDTLMKEVEKRAEEKLSRIPRFVADNVFIPNITPAQPTTPDILKKKNGQGIKMDSIDKYLEKKKKRASEHLKFNDNFKENTLPAKRLKTSVSTSALKKPRERRKSVKVDPEITINFGPSIKSTPNIGANYSRISPRLAALNERNRPKPKINPPMLTDTNKTVIINSSEKLALREKGNKRANIPVVSSRKSGVQKPVSRKSEARKSIDARKSINARKSMDARKSVSEKSPSLSKVQTPKSKTPSKTPSKFDLKASLKKPLTYKPHTGKLKAVYFTQESAGLPRKVVKKDERKTDKKTSVKEITKNATTREKRRNEAAAKREKSRLVVLDKRRGIVC